MPERRLRSRPPLYEQGEPWTGQRKGRASSAVAAALDPRDTPWGVPFSGQSGAPTRVPLGDESLKALREN